MRHRETPKSDPKKSYSQDRIRIALTQKCNCKGLINCYNNKNRANLQFANKS